MPVQKCSDDAILDFIHDYTAAKGYPPTKREIAGACGLVVSAMHRRLRILAAQERIEMVPNAARTIRVLG